MADEGREPTKPKDGARSGSQVTGLDPFGGNSTGSDDGPDEANDPIHDTETTIEDSFAGGGIAHGAHSSARGTGGTGIGIDGTGLGGTAGGEDKDDLDFGGSIPQ